MWEGTDRTGDIAAKAEVEAGMIEAATPDDLATDGRGIVEAAARSLGCGDLDPARAASIVDLLVANQVPLLSIEAGRHRGEAGPVLSSEAFEQAVAVDREVFEQAMVHYSNLEREWSRRGIEAICFKSAGVAPAFPYTSENFDILVRPEHRHEAHRVMEELGYVELRNVEEHQKWLFRLFAGGQSLSAIHLHTRVGWGQGFMLDAEIFERARPADDDSRILVPGFEDAILINVAHALYENKAVGLHDLMKIRHAAANDVDWRYVHRVAEQRGWLEGLMFGLQLCWALEARLFTNGNPRELPMWAQGPLRGRAMEIVRQASIGTAPAMPFPTSFVLTKKLFFEKIARDKQTSAASKAATAFLSLARGVKGQIDAHPQPSALFTLSGVDGSGKTVQAESLAQVFKTSELRSRIVWARLGATPMMYRASGIWRGRTRRAESQRGSDSREPAATGGEGSASRSRVAVRAWGVMSTLDFAVWLARIRWRLARGDIVIADRYVADLDVEMTLRLDDFPKLRGALVRGLRAFAPRPRKAFLLDVDEETARKRARPDDHDFAPGPSIEEYRNKARVYRLERIDASKPLDDSGHELETGALRAYLHRYGTVGNLFFFSNPWQLNRGRKSRREG